VEPIGNAVRPRCRGDAVTTCDKIFLRTSEPHAAKWISDTIGDIEIERMRESRSKGQYGQRSFVWNARSSHCYASDISGLPVAAGYLKLENLVALSATFPFVDVRHGIRFVERSTIETTRRSTVATPSAKPPARSFSRPCLRR